MEYICYEMILVIEYEKYANLFQAKVISEFFWWMINLTYKSLRFYAENPFKQCIFLHFLKDKKY
jgi:hypothetical protein